MNFDKNDEISVKHCEMNHHILTISETDLVLHNTTFS